MKKTKKEKAVTKPPIDKRDGTIWKPSKKDKKDLDEFIADKIMEKLDGDGPRVPVPPKLKVIKGRKNNDSKS